MSTTPTLETCAGLYAAACAIPSEIDRMLAIAHVVTSAQQHGYTMRQLDLACAASSTTPALK